MDKQLHILQITRVVGKLYEKLRQQVCGKYGLQAIETDILAFLANNPDKNTAVEISQTRKLQKSNVSQALVRLEEKGLIECRPDEGDKRRVRLFITNNASHMLPEIEALKIEFFNMILDGFTEGEKKLLEEMTMRIEKNAQKALERMDADERQ